ADPARSRILQALGDNRALAASVLADEAGIAASTASSHLKKLVDGGFLAVERHGRHRYFRLAGPHVGELIEALARVAPPAPVKSLKEGTRAQAVRFARTCYDHLAGKLGTELMAAMIERGWLEGGDGTFDPARAEQDRLSAPGWDVDYRVSELGVSELAAFGVQLGELPARRRLVRYCIDWSEQRHHLAGALGAAVAERSFELGWVRRADNTRAVHLTDDGVEGFRETFGVSLLDDGDRVASRN
ncbi:MAG TPA: winged helix-turn-helix domain-containing protein, partial [Thermoleophilaceae bacterium]|nr:winged helix-turn-helix domain-containing protein [Thermoleophilaceae bacterium]